MRSDSPLLCVCVCVFVCVSVFAFFSLDPAQDTIVAYF